MVHLLEKVGLPETGLNEAEAPEGRPDRDKDAVWIAPEIRLTVIVLDSEPP